MSTHSQKIYVAVQKALKHLSTREYQAALLILHQCQCMSETKSSALEAIQQMITERF